MIVFCEDCGGKNSLPTAKIENRRIVFQCSSCAYRNNYALESSDKSILNQIRINLKQISSRPDVIGGFVYHRNKEVLIDFMSDLLTRDDLIFLGKKLLENISICQEQYRDIEQMVLFISNRHTVVRALDTNRIIVVICQTIKAVQSIFMPLDSLITNCSMHKRKERG